jgi:hypothetical protein
VTKGDIIKLTFFTRGNGFKGGGTRVLVGRCMFLKQRHQWVILHFCVIFKYVKFFFKIPLLIPLITNVHILDSKKYVKEKD